MLLNLLFSFANPTAAHDIHKHIICFYRKEKNCVYDLLQRFNLIKFLHPHIY